MSSQIKCVRHGKECQGDTDDCPKFLTVEQFYQRKKQGIPMCENMVSIFQRRICAAKPVASHEGIARCKYCTEYRIVGDNYSLELTAEVVYDRSAELIPEAEAGYRNEHAFAIAHPEVTDRQMFCLQELFVTDNILPKVLVELIRQYLPRYAYFRAWYISPVHLNLPRSYRNSLTSYMFMRVQVESMRYHGWYNVRGSDVPQWIVNTVRDHLNKDRPVDKYDVTPQSSLQIVDGAKPTPWTLPI